MGSVVIIEPEARLREAWDDAFSHYDDAPPLCLISGYPTLAELSAALTRPPMPRALAVGFAEPERAAALVEGARALRPELRIVGVGARSSGAGFSAAERAGVEAFLSPPFSMVALLGDEEAAVPARDPSLGSMVGFVPAQGGSGASTTAIHVAGALSRSPQAQPASGPWGVLLVDFDFHGGATAFRLRLESHGTISDALEGAAAGRSLRELSISRWNGFDILPAANGPGGLSEEAARSVQLFFQEVKRQYRFVILDLPTALYSSCRDALRMCEMVCVVSKPEPMSLYLAKRRVADALDLGFKPDQVRLVLSRVVATAGPPPDVDLPEGVETVAGVPNRYAVVTEAFLGGRLVSFESDLGRQYAGLAKAIAQVF